MQAEFQRAAPNGALCAALMGLLNGTLRDFGAAILVAPAEAVGAPPGRFFHSPAGSDDDGREGPSRESSQFEADRDGGGFADRFTAFLHVALLSADTAVQLQASELAHTATCCGAPPLADFLVARGLSEHLFELVACSSGGGDAGAAVLNGLAALLNLARSAAAFSREQLPRGFVVLLKVVERALLAKDDAALEAALKLLAEGLEACDQRAVPQAGLVQLLDLCECLVLTGGLSAPEPLPTRKPVLYRHVCNVLGRLLAPPGAADQGGDAVFELQAVAAAVTVLMPLGGRAGGAEDGDTAAACAAAAGLFDCALRRAATPPMMRLCRSLDKAGHPLGWCVWPV